MPYDVQDLRAIELGNLQNLQEAAFKEIDSPQGFLVEAKDLLYNRGSSDESISPVAIVKCVDESSDHVGHGQDPEEVQNSIITSHIDRSEASFEVDVFKMYRHGL